MTWRKVPIAVIGGHSALPGNAAYDTALELGRELANRGHSIICGGRLGVMEAVCKGCIEAGGTSIGVLPTSNIATANQYCTIIIPTVLGNHTDDPVRNRNSVIVAGALCVFAIGGKNGVRNELTLAQDNGRRVFGLHNPGNGWNPPIWIDPESSFTLHGTLNQALTACGAYIRANHLGIVW